MIVSISNEIVIYPCKIHFFYFFFLINNDTDYKYVKINLWTFLVSKEYYYGVCDCQFLHTIVS